MKASEFFKNILTTGDLSQGLTMIGVHTDELKKIEFPVEVEFEDDKEYLVMFCISQSFVETVLPGKDLYLELTSEEKIEVVTKTLANGSNSVIAELRYTEF